MQSFEPRRKPSQRTNVSHTDISLTRQSRRASSIYFIVVGLLLVATISFILYNGCQSPDESWKASTGFSEIFAPVLHALHDAVVAVWGWTGNQIILSYDSFVRKLAHFTEYALLGVECAALVYGMRGRVFCGLTWIALLVPLAVASTDEFVQGFVGRSGMVSDVLLDFVGACCGVLVTALCCALMRQRDR